MSDDDTVGHGPRPDPADGQNGDSVEVEVELLAVDEPDDGRDVGEVDESIDDDGDLEYDCTSWAGESRALLGSLLETHGIPHAWQGTVVTVHPEDEEEVDSLIDEVLASARPALDPAAPRVVYEVASYPVAFQTSLADALTVADLPYEWDERGDLVVYAEHEEEVEAILEQLPEPDDAELSADDGIAVHQLFDSVFVAADRLSRRPDDAGSIVALVDAADDLERTGMPFGFEAPQWRRLVGAVVELRDALEASGHDVPDDDAVRGLAGRVAATLRTYI